MRHGSLFSGIGGFDLAAEWMGWENVFHCEWNPFGQKVLHHYWPNAEQFTDITKSDFTKYHGTIDIISGGFPCQPYSMAGKRLGKEDDRHLWPEMLRAIREVQPTWVVGENVFGLVNWSGGLVFHEVQADLEAEGYEVQPYVLPAAAVNAPHRRDRVWFVAKNTNKNGWRSEQWQEESKERRQWNSCSGDNECLSSDNGETRHASYTESMRINREEKYENSDRQGRKWGRCNLNNISKVQGRNIASNTDCNGFNQCDCEHEINTSEGRFNALSDSQQGNGNGDASDTHCSNCQTRSFGEILEQQNWQKTNGYSNVECANKWENFPTVSPICNGDDGLSNRLDSITFPKWRAESIKAGGNAIVPQVAFQIFKTIKQYERLH